jgi:hypothetical protein
MEIGDLVKFYYKDGAVSSFTGIFLTEGSYGISPYVELFVEDRILKLYKFDYIFEVINESRRSRKV